LFLYLKSTIIPGSLIKYLPPLPNRLHWQHLAPWQALTSDLLDLAFNPSFCTTLALSGTADTPAAPTNGFILFSSLKNKFMILAKISPPAVAIINESAPKIKISMDYEVRNTFDCVEAPTVNPRSIVTISIKEFLAVFASLSVTPDSFNIFPKKSMPNNGNALGEINVVNNKPIIGNIIFSSLDTALGGFILIFLSFSEVKSFMIGG